MRNHGAGNANNRVEVVRVLDPMPRWWGRLRMLVDKQTGEVLYAEAEPYPQVLFDTMRDLQAARSLVRALSGALIALAIATVLNSCVKNSAIRAVPRQHGQGQAVAAASSAPD